MKKIVSFKKLSVFLALIIFLSSVLAGCGGQNAGEKNAPMKVAVYAQMHIPITDWDPSVEMSNGVIVLCNIYETLLKYDPLNKEFIPVLATDYRKSDDGLVWEFDIRENVKFHDGTELNAEAVKFSIERTMELGKGPAFIWDPVDEINVKDDYTVEFKLKYPSIRSNCCIIQRCLLCRLLQSNQILTIGCQKEMKQGQALICWKAIKWDKKWFLQSLKIIGKAGRIIRSIKL